MAKHSIIVEWIVGRFAFTRIDADCVAGEIVEECGTEAPGMSVSVQEAESGGFGSRMRFCVETSEAFDGAAVTQWLADEEPGSSARVVA